MVGPLYSIGDTVYLKESAENGFLEAVRIASVVRSTNEQWTYTIIFGHKLPSPPSFGERITHQYPNVLYFNESELITFCDAANIVESVLSQRLAAIRQQQSDFCQ